MFLHIDTVADNCEDGGVSPRGFSTFLLFFSSAAERVFKRWKEIIMDPRMVPHKTMNNVHHQGVDPLVKRSSPKSFQVKFLVFLQNFASEVLQIITNPTFLTKG